MTVLFAHFMYHVSICLCRRIIIWEHFLLLLLLLVRFKMFYSKHIHKSMNMSGSSGLSIHFFFFFVSFHSFIPFFFGWLLLLALFWRVLHLCVPKLLFLLVLIEYWAQIHNIIHGTHFHAVNITFYLFWLVHFRYYFGPLGFWWFLMILSIFFSLSLSVVFGITNSVTSIDSIKILYSHQNRSIYLNIKIAKVKREQQQ